MSEVRDTVIILLLCLLVLLVHDQNLAQARPVYRDALTTWFGPGFYGNTFACGGTYYRNKRGVAHRTLPCGTKLTLRKRGARVHVRVIDRGPYSAALFDLTARTAMDLCRCTKPYTMSVKYLRGWK